MVKKDLTKLFNKFITYQIEMITILREIYHNLKNFSPECNLQTCNFLIIASQFSYCAIILSITEN